MWLENFYDDIDRTVFYIFCAITGLVALLAVVGVIIQLCSKGKSKPGDSIDLSVQIGAILLCVTVLVRGVQSTTSKDSLEILCDLYPALLLVGLTQFVGGLFVKAWSVYLYNTFNKDDKKPLAEEWKPNLWMWFLMVVVAAIIIVWAVLFEPKLIVDAKNYTCTSDRVFEWRTASSVWHAFLLFLAVVAVPMNCYVNPNAQVTLLSLVIFNTLFCTVAAVVAYYTYENDTNTATWDYAISGGLIMWAAFFANIITVIGKFTGRSQEEGDEETKRRPGSDHYATIDSRRKSDQTQDTALPGDD
ncbi:hypothetical protein LSAT2_020182, partial [Lamellibrachia satsuma]